MGGSLVRYRQLALYHREDPPECVNMTFNFQRELFVPDMAVGSLLEFDDGALLRRGGA